jgi:hypothetical protein
MISHLLYRHSKYVYILSDSQDASRALCLHHLNFIFVWNWFQPMVNWLNTVRSNLSLLCPDQTFEPLRIVLTFHHLITHVAYSVLRID